ncbi:GNAT family N-acetyltransferase [Roseibium limicola]|uniref:GNAT family N-acetyltransferase n=1 Tax=Roseibium limicola TaxID=2816037 RepID=A0A939EJR7_9HYPH|nr:GNAT family N-acetyltransferase [Roseibium limicola]MBO0343859.1 GNAT family N-acetyltransferase [Roseibium limicola]
MSILIRALTSEDRSLMYSFLTERWAGPEILLGGETVDASQLPGFIGLNKDEIAGLVTVVKRDGEWEILTLDSVSRWAGTGTELLEALVADAREAGITRLTVRLSNDNLDAFRFYQRRGFRFEKIAQGVIDEERELKPEIPTRGEYGIPLHDEILFAREL